MIYLNLLVFVAFLTFFCPSFYSGEDYSNVVSVGIPYVLAVLFRFYTISFFVADIRMAQTVFFYGSLFFMFLFLAIWFNVVFAGASVGNVSSVASTSVSTILTILDPTFGFFIVIVYQHNFVGVMTQLDTKSVMIAAAGQLSALIIGVFLYLGTLILFDGVGDWVMSLFSKTTPNKASVAYTSSSQSLDSRNSISHQEDVGNDDMIVSSSDIRISTVATARPTPSLRISGLVDPDVVMERRRVNELFTSRQINPNQHAIFIHDLNKVYYGRGTAPTKVAVKSVSITIPHGEVFGLLGANGAGKVVFLSHLRFF